MGSAVILDLMGGVALLLWGLHMVHSGIVRAFGADLRRLLGVALQNRFRAFLAGAFVTALLQSSTATGLMAASFVTGGTVDLVPALAVMLGANVGTTLVVQVLSFDITLLTPILLMTGVIAFKRGGRTRTRDLGRAAIGIGLMLLALHIFLGALMTTESSTAARALLGAITNQPLLCLLLAAAMTWAAHSSVAVVLVVMSLGAAQLVSPTAVLAMVLGANLGSALNPLIEASQPRNPGQPATARRQSPHSRGRLRPRIPVSAAHCRPAAAVRAEHRAPRGRLPHRLQCAARPDFHRPSERAGQTADTLAARPAEGGGSGDPDLFGHELPPVRPPWRWSARPARSCAWATSSKRCCARR